MLSGKRISMVAAMAANRVIGAANDIPWRVPGEQQRFRQLTEGHLVVMGRRTYESIGRCRAFSPTWRGTNARH